MYSWFGRTSSRGRVHDFGRPRLMAPSRPTLGQVAEHAGVSAASVSRVLNDLPASPGMTARVRAAAAELGYAPDAMARSLKVGRTEQIALVVADIGNPVYVAMMHAVGAVVRTAGYRLLLSTGESDPDEEIEIVRGLSHGYADGLVLCPLRVTEPLLDELRAIRVPTVVIGRVPADLAVDNVRADSVRGVGMAVRHLVDTGRSRIALINGPVDTVPGSARQRGFDRAIRRLGAARNPALIETAEDFTFDAGRAAAERLLDRTVPDAVVCANDLLAVGALHTLAARGLVVPDEVAIVGVDDTELAGMVHPALTSVSLGSADRGRIAATLLLDRLEDPSRPPRRITVAPRLVVRGSTVAPLRLIAGGR